MLTIIGDSRARYSHGGPGLKPTFDFVADKTVGPDTAALLAEARRLEDPAPENAAGHPDRTVLTVSRLLRQMPEVAFALAMLAATLALGAWNGWPVNLPAGNRAAFVGIHYLYPLVGVAIWGAFAAIGQRRALARTFFIALPCYAVVLVCHFNIKLWAPLLNPVLWDDIYWRTDAWLRPLVDGSIALRTALSPMIALDSNFYMIAFIAMFYISFCFHALKSPQQFRTLFLAALLFQGLGALAYLVAPAIGPFLYESGIEPLQTEAQSSMLKVRADLLAGGATWLADKGGTHITVGLAAMPSLHTGGSFLFLLFAWRYARVLVPLYTLLFGFIAIDAVASRWHYIVDLPAGIALALTCAWIAERLNPRADESERRHSPGPAEKH